MARAAIFGGVVGLCDVESIREFRKTYQQLNVGQASIARRTQNFFEVAEGVTAVDGWMPWKL